MRGGGVKTTFGQCPKERRFFSDAFPKSQKNLVTKNVNQKRNFSHKKFLVTKTFESQKMFSHTFYLVTIKF